MNLGIITSYIVAGMILLSMLMMNLRVSASSSELTITQITREHVTNIAEMLNDDIPNIGYNIDSKWDPAFAFADSNKIQFYRNIYDDPTRDPELVTWEFTGEEVTGTGNPNDYVLKQTIKDAATGVETTTEIRSGVTHFRIRYYFEHGKDRDSYETTPISASNYENIKQIFVELEVQSTEAVSYSTSLDGRYIRSVWEKRFSPQNIE
jgi:hypothetical protein